MDQQNRITMSDIEAEIASEAYFTACDGIEGAANRLGGYEEVGVTVRHTDDNLELPAKMVTICLLVLHNGHKVIGANYGPVDPAEFSAEEGRRQAKAAAVERLYGDLAERA